MRKILFFLFGFLFNINLLFSQNLQYEMPNVEYVLNLEPKYKKEVYDIKDYPKSITRLLDRILTKTFGKHLANFKYKSGFIRNLDEYFEKYPDELNNNGTFPSYTFLYNWTDTTIGVKRYEVCLGLDKIGQIIYLNFPRHHDFDDISFESLDKAKLRTDSLINIDSLHFYKTEINLEYNKCEDDLIWSIYYYPISDLPGLYDKDFEVSMIRKICKVVDNKNLNLERLEPIEFEDEDIILKEDNNK